MPWKDGHVNLHQNFNKKYSTQDIQFVKKKSALLGPIILSSLYCRSSFKDNIRSMDRSILITPMFWQGMTEDKLKDPTECKVSRIKNKVIALVLSEVIILVEALFVHGKLLTEEQDSW